MALNSTELKRFYDKVVSTDRPEDLFGELVGSSNELEEAVDKEYRRLVKSCHPDKYRSATRLDQYRAEEAFKQLAKLHDLAHERINQGLYGKPDSTVTSANPLAVLKHGAREYRLTSAIAEGMVAQIYGAEYTEVNGNVRRVCVKIAIDPADNLLIRNEQTILQKLTHISLPKVIDTFIADGKAVTVFSFVDGYDVYALRDLPRYKNGLMPQFHIGWFIERQLSLLGYLHSNMVVHGNIEPGHLIINPCNHNVTLVGFCFSVANPTDKDYIRIQTPNFSSPEVSSKLRPLPTLDLYGLGKTAIYLLGGDPATDVFPSDLHPAVSMFIRHMVDPDYLRRARDAWQMAHLLISIRMEAFGNHGFIPLPV